MLKDPHLHVLFQGVVSANCALGIHKEEQGINQRPSSGRNK